MKRGSRNGTDGSARYCGALVVVLLGAGALAAVPEWTELGPAPLWGSAWYAGRVSAVVCSPTDSELYYAAGADGGVWRTTDGGASWTALTDHLPTTAIGALALDPTDESIVYAGSGEANYANHSRPGMGLYKSTDGGDTWEVLAAEVFRGRCFSRILVDPTDPQRLFAAITRAGGFPELAAAKGYPDATGPIGVFRSTDAGVTWTHLTNGLPALCATDLAMDPTNPNVLYAGIGRIFGDPTNGIYKSTDGGESWSKLAGGLPDESIGRISVAVAPSLATRLYAMITRAADEAGGGAEMEGAYRSDDGGATWTRTALINIQATYGWFLSVISIDPQNPQRVFMGGVYLYRTDNGGDNWSAVTPPHVDMHGIDWDAAGRMIVGNDGGVHRTNSFGDDWESRNEGLGTAQCYAGISINPGTGYIYSGLQDNGTVGQTPTLWRHWLGGDGGWTQVDQERPRFVFAELQGTGNLYKSSSLGSGMVLSSTGINPDDRNCFLPPYLIDPNDSARMIYGTHRMYLSTNYGESWSVLSGDLTGGGSAAIQALAIAPTDSLTIYAATNDGRILVSSDGGENWSIILANVPGWPRITRELFVDPTDANTLYAAVAHYGEPKIRRTKDRGQTWEILEGTFPDIPVNVVAVDVRGARPIIYAGAEDGVYRTVNEGANWHRLGHGMPNAAVIDLVLDFPRSRLVAATQGRGIWSLPVALPGDMNGDGAVNVFDIDPFVLALVDPAAYAAQYPGVDPVLPGDLDGDGAVTSFDIDPFVQVLTGN